MRLQAFRAAFPHTIPIFAGYWFLGLTYGIYATTSGFSPIYPIIMAIVIFGGSLEFVTVSMLLSPFAPLQTFVIALMIQARHLFYGISMLDKYKDTGIKKFFLIYGMSDETFSITYTAKTPDGIDKGWFMLFITILDQIYWISGVAIGSLLGSVLTFNTNGISFVMTAMFSVIFLDQWLKDNIHVPGVIGVVSSVICLIIFGPDSFMLPTMVVVIALLTVFRKPMEQKENLLVNLQKEDS